MKDLKRWTVTEEISTAHETQVFSGGACNILDSDGNLLRNQERDQINNWLTGHNIRFFDPQIHPDTHGIDYNYEIHHPLELAARRAARINLYEVSPRSFGGISSFEIAADHFRSHEPIVIYYSDGDHTQDRLPDYSSKGHPLFVPDGLSKSDQARHAHYREFIKNGNHIRKYLMNFAREMTTLTVTFDMPVRHRDVVISPYRLHAADLFSAVVKASSGERVFVTFTGGSDVRDSLGNPLFVAPIHPPEVELRALLDQYVDEGNELRRAIAEMVNVNVFTRVVYTQKSAILAMEELLRIKGLIQ
ncbi:MAG TPA: hypothetical protein VHL11_15585 [Phototrophicaceae bacterium]|jgi:hypothetical protein|nr:hypothetical protein [Phototrophicaceae bacterium]